MTTREGQPAKNVGRLVLCAPGKNVLPERATASAALGSSIWVISSKGTMTRGYDFSFRNSISIDTLRGVT